MLTRIRAVAVKELWGLIRQPQLVLLLLAGPALIMMIFGLSLDVQNILRPRAVVVVEPGSEGAALFERFRQEFTDRTQFVGTTDDLEEAERLLLRGEVDAVISIPPDPLGTVASGERPVLHVLYNTINPVFGTRVPSRSYSLVLDLNQSLVREAIESEIGAVRSLQERIAVLNGQLEQASATAETLSSQEARTATAELDESLTTLERTLRLWQTVRNGEEDREISAALERIGAAQQAVGEVREAQEAGPEAIKERSGLAELRETVTSVEEALGGLPANVPARVLASPFTLKVENLASPPQQIVGFYAPGVLAILIQHIAVSLASLALIRERLRGSYEFFEVSPLGPGQLLVGKFVAYCGLVLGVNLAAAIILSSFLDIPVAGGFLRMALAMLLVTISSLGLGFSISALAKSELQALQVSMLLLIASGFFAGFLFPLSEMTQPAVGLSYLLPATYGIQALQDVMIRGAGVSGPDAAGLLAITGVTLLLSRYLMRRKQR
jgi:ABC-2 type transport system permease protein